MNFNKVFKDLEVNGYAMLPELKFILSEIKKQYIKDLKKEFSKTNKKLIENSSLHELFLEESTTNKKLINFLYQKVSLFTKKEIYIKDLYKITRITISNTRTVSDRPHFDSHIFTLIVPVEIPKSSSYDNKGQLVLFNKLRKEPINEFINFFGKVYYLLFFNSKIRDLIFP